MFDMVFSLLTQRDGQLQNSGVAELFPQRGLNVTDFQARLQ
ncbi:hypothetical protein [Bradyrhizobium sp.]|nr:hypothetical protein [Bradyrhizobium sp.]